MRAFRDILEDAVIKRYKIKVSDVVKEAGNSWKKCKDSDCIYKILVDAQEKVIKQMFEKGFGDVVEASNTDLQDWADNKAPAPDVNDMIKKKDPKLFKTIMDKKKELQAKKWKGEKEETGQMKTLIQKFMDKHKVYGLEAGFVLNGFWN